MLRHTLISDFLEHSALRYPGKTALAHEGEGLTYAAVDSMANSLAAVLMENGIRRGDRVAVFMDNSIEAVVSIFAIAKAGAAFMMINHTTKSEKLEYIMNDSGAKALVTQGNRTAVVEGATCRGLQTVIVSGSCNGGAPYIRYEDAVRAFPCRSIRPACIDLDLASIIYTSGSTGFPKGVTLSHLNMVSAAHSITTYLENDHNDRIITVLPLSFDYGLYQVLMGFKIGGTVILEKSFAYPYQVVDTMVREKATGFPGVPTIFAILLRLKNLEQLDFSSLRYITNTAAALPLSHIRRLREIFPKAKLYSMYGLTECKRVSYLPPEEIEQRPSSIGKGMPNEEVYLVNERGERVGPGETGELVVRGSHVMMGYWGMPEETARCLRPGAYPGERVLHTGDLFRTDEDGYLYFIARKDDIIKCKGEKVSPREVENVLYGIDGVLEAAVIGVPDEILGQAVKAYVVPEQGAQLSARDIMRHCSQRLEAFMVPHYVEIRDSLPKTATGKINKNELKTA